MLQGRGSERIFRGRPQLPVARRSRSMEPDGEERWSARLEANDLSQGYHGLPALDRLDLRAGADEIFV